AVNGFSKGFTEQPDHPEYRDAAMGILDYIEKHFIDSRSGEWYNELDEKSDLPKHKELAGPWKCPYHNGRMWLELMKL
ncbi:MAG: AGE family epimerase/isomerase, partial [Clostridia bacterium]|nr:AGE family epimerase/isomerase [Clostridia bacterium]